jgi:hypothetical protein
MAVASRLMMMVPAMAHARCVLTIVGGRVVWKR